MSSEPRIVIQPHPERVVVRFAGRTVVDTTRALALREGSHGAVLYLPREDADMSLLVRTDRTTRCPYKGAAAYYTIEADGRTAENAVWTYEAPIPEASAIAGHLAFYPDRVDSIDDGAGR